MDRHYIDNRHVLARYLADQLSEEELRAFEDYLASYPEIVNELEAAARIKVGLHKLGASGELNTLLKPKLRLQKTRFLAMAASIAVIALGVTLWLSRSAFETPHLTASLSVLTDHAGKPLPIAGSYAILRTRGISYDAEIELPVIPQAIELRVLPEVEAQPARYRVAIAQVADDNSLEILDTVGALALADDGFVELYFDSSKFTPGRYQLTIGGDVDTNAAKSVSAFRIKLSSPKPSTL